MVPIIIGISLVNSFVVKGYTQYLREKREASETISEDEKLRAFDRTHWDSREETLESIQTPSVQFTDTFRWTLCREDGGIGKSEQEEEESKPFGGASTFSMIETSSSDEEHGEKPSITNTESSNTSNSENIDFAVPSGDHSATTAGSQTNPDVASSTTTESQQDSTEDKSYDT